MKMTSTLEQVLSASGYVRTADSDDSVWSEMTAVWDRPAADDGPVTDADIDDFISTLADMKLVEKKPAVRTRSQVPSAFAAGPSILVLTLPDDALLSRHLRGSFTNPDRGLAFEADDGHATRLAIESYDRRFLEMFSWLGHHHIYLTLAGRQSRNLFFVSDIRAAKSDVIDGNYGEVDDSFLQATMGHILTSSATDDEAPVGNGPEPTLTSSADIRNFMGCASGTLPSEIRTWAWANIALLDTDGVSEQEGQHAMRALALMLNVHWKSSRFEPIDPKKARKILDEELYGLDAVKQRVIETIIQINRTRTLPAYGLLLVGPAGTGKSRIAYAVAEILKIPFTVFDMSTVSDPEALTGTSRIYSNGRPGRIMEAFSQTGSSNLVFVINELDKAEGQGGRGNAADTLLTLFDNLGYTDNYMECRIPTGGVYPIATANDLKSISKPLLSRFSVIEIPDYSPEEKEIIFRDFSLPKTLKRLSMKPGECVVTDAAIKRIVSLYAGRTGCRDLEQAAERLCGNALYRIETEGLSSVTYGEEEAAALLT